MNIFVSEKRGIKRTVIYGQVHERYTKASSLDVRVCKKYKQRTAPKCTAYETILRAGRDRTRKPLVRSTGEHLLLSSIRADLHKMNEQLKYSALNACPTCMICSLLTYSGFGSAQNNVPCAYKILCFDGVLDKYTLRQFS